MPTLLGLCALTLVVTGFGVAFLILAWRAWQSGQARARHVSVERQHQPGLFWLTIGLYIFGGASLLCWALIMVGMMGLYTLELAVK